MLLLERMWDLEKGQGLVWGPSKPEWELAKSCDAEHYPTACHVLVYYLRST